MKPADALYAELCAGQAEYSCRVAIRDLIETVGEEAARERIRAYLDDEARRVNPKRFAA